MSDDIDIEEHDILDNPHIRNIFPDLSVVKKEISEYYNEDLPVKQLIKQEPESCVLKSPQLHSSNIPNNKVCETIEDKNDEEHTSSPNDCVKKLETNISFQKNKIIIGSKPSKDGKNDLHIGNKTQIRYPKVFLHDVRSNLEKSERYCKECRILFAEKNKWSEHNMKKHSTSKKQVITRTTFNTKNNGNENSLSHITQKKSDVEKSGSKLNSIADETHKHLKRDTINESDELKKPSTRSGSSKTSKNENVIPTSSDTSSSEESDIEMPLAESNSSDSSEEETVVESISKEDIPQCRICDIRVANRGNLVRHYRAIHHKKLTFTSKNTIDLSKRNSGNKLSSRKSDNVSDSSNRCRICNIEFSSIYSLKRHMNGNVHNSNVKSSLNFKINQRAKAQKLITRNTKTTNSDAENKKCFHCNKEFPDSQSLIEHVYEILKPKITRNSDRILNKIKHSEYDIVSNTHLEAKKEPNIHDLRANKVKTHSNEKHLEARNKKSNRKYLLRTKIITDTNTINSNKRRLKARNKKNLASRIKNKNNALNNYKNQFKARFEFTDKKYLSPTKRKINNTAMKRKDKENNTKDKIYVCQHCTYCFLALSNYVKHVINRHGTKLSKINRQIFNKQCKYCPSKNSSPLYHNNHLNKQHLDILEKKITSENIINEVVPESGKYEIDNMENSNAFAFKSALFKCERCDVHFVSSDTAKDHTGHMESLINWKCSICDLIFKKIDENIHLLQHLSSEHITVHEFSCEALSSLLYNCTKCTIHFSEKEYLDHYKKCENETAISTYCKACDILVNEADVNTHRANHRKNEVFSPNVITSDIIFYDKTNSVDTSVTVNRKNIKKKKITINSKSPKIYNSMNTTFTYCPTCQCFMILVKKIHLKKQCTKMIKHICVDCGLLLTNKSLDTHRKHHKMKDLTIQDYTFTDLSGNIINPPIPEFPQCKICKVYFVNKLDIISHVCVEFTDVTSCDICKIKLSNTAFKLHMGYHKYCFKKDKEIANNKKPTTVKKQKVVSEDVHAAENTTNATLIDSPYEKSQDVNETQNSSIIKIDPNIAILFSCKSCFITLNTYDKLIEHCQNHTINEKVQSPVLRSCNVCNLKFDFPTYEIHKEIHTNKLTIKNFTVDIQHFVFDKKIWLNNVFRSLNSNQINKIIEKSIYQNEHRVKLKMLQSGPHDLTIYKCARCSLFFNHEDVFIHANCKNLNVRGTSCASCGLKFLSGALRNKHVKIHFAHPKIDEKSYRIILFNHDLDDLNKAAKPNQYILYQCRKCNGVIDKSANHQCSINDLQKCNDCGLLIYKQTFKNHAHDHKNLTNFEPDNMKVILFGTKEDKTDSEVLFPHPNFKGLIYDYTLYQCKYCEICVKNDSNISNHVCVFGIYRCQCYKCDYFFNSKGYNHHIKTHNLDPDFKKENINIIQFDLKSDGDVKAKLKKEEDKEDTKQKVKDESENKLTVVLYKCMCGLHFVDRCKLTKHINQCNPKLKTHKQNCTKCNLLFNPSELFSHLVNHHGNKNQPIKYDVKEITEENMEDLLKVILYNCSKCGLHYLDKIVAGDHYKLCKGDTGDFEECTKCKIIYDKSSFVLDEHNDNCENKFEIEIIDENNIEFTANTALSQKCDNSTTEH